MWARFCNISSTISSSLKLRNVSSMPPQFHFWVLGFVISGDSIQMEPARVSAVMDCLTPTSCKLVQCFLGFAKFYRSFIRNFSTISAPLHAPLPMSSFSWPPGLSCLPEAEGELHLGTHPHTTWPQLSVLGGGGCFVLGYRGRSLSAVTGW